MFGADFVNVNAQLGIFFRKRAGGAGVIEVDVSDEQRGNVCEFQPTNGQVFSQHGKARRRAAINQREFAIAFKQIQADGFAAVEKVQINDGCA